MNNIEIMLTQLLTNWLGSDNIHFSEKAVFNQPVLLITYILNFLPMDSCGVCYRVTSVRNVRNAYSFFVGNVRAD